jgi:riboflavin synthase
LIPHTLRATSFGDLREGDPVNVEVDVVAKYVARNMESLLNGGDTGEHSAGTAEGGRAQEGRTWTNA